MSAIGDRGLQSYDSEGADRSVPAARPLDDFCMEPVGDEVVMYDETLDRYHTLNLTAFEIWRQCDGAQTRFDIGRAMSNDGKPMAIETIDATVSQLGEAGLLQASETEFDSTLDRRRMMKLVAAGVIGAVGIPIVASITRLGPEAAASHGQCHPAGTSCTPFAFECCGINICCRGTCMRIRDCFGTVFPADYIEGQDVA